MAVTPMQSITIVGHAGLRGEILAALHKLGVVQLTEIEEATGDDAEQQAPASGLRDRLRQDSHERVAATDRRLTEVTACLTYINRYSPIQKGLVESFLAAREAVDSATWQQAAAYDYAPLLAVCQKGEARLAEIRSRESELGTRISELAPLTGLPLDLGALEGTGQVAVFFGQALSQRLQALAASLAGLTQPTHLERLGAVGRQEYFMLLYFRGDTAVSDLIRASGIEPASVPAAETTAEAAVAAARAELSELAAERERIAAEGRELAAERRMLYIVYDRLLLQKQQEEAQVHLTETAKTFLLQGWCPSEQVTTVERALQPYAQSVAMQVRDPRPNEHPPVRLANNRLSGPFEIVTNIYGWPSYHEVDPTPVLAPFFATFFALALTDAGYGLIMVAYCWSMMRKKTTPVGSHKFFRLMMYGGFTTIVIGALTNGWFGNALDYLPPALGFITRAKNSLVLFDPIKSPMVLMGISLVLGVLHLMVGIGVKGYMAIKAGRVRDAVIDQGLWLVLLPSLGLMATGSILGPAVAQVGRYLAIGAAVGLVLTQGRAAKNIVGKVFGGLYSLYGLIGYLSDTLSYTRLLALGLATGSLGMAINQIAMLVRPVPVIGIVLMLMVMALGHGVSLLINVFGAFIHAGRLQFVEFFTKFFEGGGKAFKPFAQRPKFTEVTPD